MASEDDRRTAVGLLPLTPFHFGPGLFVKSLAPRRFSFASFVATQVVIDCESLYNMLRGEYPIHRTLHTLAGATVAGLTTSAALIAVATIVTRMLRRNPLEGFQPSLRSELSSTSIVLGGVVGGASHSILDAIVHSDVRPFAPLSDANPFFRSLGSSTLEAACVVLGMIGLILLTWHAKKQYGR